MDNPSEEKIDFADLPGCKGCLFSLPVNFKSDGMTLHKLGLADETFWPGASEDASLISSGERGLQTVETSVSGNAECLLAIGEGKKSKVFGVTFSLNN